MAPWTADSGLLAGVDHLVGFCIRLWEFGTQLATLYSLTPRLDLWAGHRHRPRRTLTVGLLKAVLILLVLLLGLPLTLPVAIVGVLLRFVLHPFKSDVLAVPCAAPGPLEYGPGDGGFAAPLRLFSLNAALSEFEIMNAINGLRLTRNRRRELWEFIAGALRPLPDFVCLQEAFSPRAVRFLQRQFTAVGYHVVAQVKPRSPIGMSSGLFIASRYRVTRIHFTPFTHAAKEDALAKKGVLLCEVASGRARGVVGTTHLQAAGPHPVRVEQLKEITQAVTHFVGQMPHECPPSFVLLAGDFNSSADSPTTALWPFTLGPTAAFRLLTSPTHATALDVRCRAVLDFAVNVQQQLWAVGPRATFRKHGSANHRDQLLLYALSTFDVQRPTLELGPEQASLTCVDCLDPTLYAKSSEGPIDHLLTLRGPHTGAATAEAVYGVPFGAGGVCSD
eukprot:EG_transcript_12693